MSREVVLFIVTVIAALLVGGVVGHAVAQSQVHTATYVSDLSGIANSVATLDLVDRGDREGVRKYQESVLSGYAARGAVDSKSVKRLRLRAPALIDQLSRGEAYAKKHNLAEVGAQLAAIRQHVQSAAQ